MKSKRYKIYSGKCLFCHYCLQLSFACKIMSQISFNLFAREIKDFYQSSIRNEVDFRDLMNASPNILAKNSNFKKVRQFCRWKSTDNNDFNIFLSLETTCTFLVAKEKTWKRIFNLNGKLSQNGTEKKIMPSKTTMNWLFNDVWC